MLNWVPPSPDPPPTAPWAQRGRGGGCRVQGAPAACASASPQPGPGAKHRQTLLHLGRWPTEGLSPDSQGTRAPRRPPQARQGSTLGHARGLLGGMGQRRRRPQGNPDSLRGAAGLPHPLWLLLRRGQERVDAHHQAGRGSNVWGPSSHLNPKALPPGQSQPCPARLSSLGTLCLLLHKLAMRGGRRYPGSAPCPLDVQGCVCLGGWYQPLSYVSQWLWTDQPAGPCRAPGWPRVSSKPRTRRPPSGGWPCGWRTAGCAGPPAASGWTALGRGSTGAAKTELDPDSGPGWPHLHLDTPEQQAAGGQRALRWAPRLAAGLAWGRPTALLWNPKVTYQARLRKCLQSPQNP